MHLVNVFKPDISSSFKSVENNSAIKNFAVKLCSNKINSMYICRVVKSKSLNTFCVVLKKQCRNKEKSETKRNKHLKTLFQETPGFGACLPQLLSSSESSRVRTKG